MTGNTAENMVRNTAMAAATTAEELAPSSKVVREALDGSCKEEQPRSPSQRQVLDKIFAKSLRRKLKKLQAEGGMATTRGTSEPPNCPRSAPGAGDATGADVVLSRFLSGSDPVISSTAGEISPASPNNEVAVSPHAHNDEGIDDDASPEVAVIEGPAAEEDHESTSYRNTFGSVSSGICSAASGVMSGMPDFASVSPAADELCGGTAGSSGRGSTGLSTPAITVARGASPTFDACVADAPELPKDGGSDDGSKSSSDPDFLTITSGEERHRVAKSKLEALISLLDPQSPRKELPSAASRTVSSTSSNSSGEANLRPRSASDTKSNSSSDSLVMEELRVARPERVRRASSLKTGKTPPGTPGLHKIVRFADVNGLDLAAVKTFLLDEIPRVPRSAYDDLEYDHPEMEEQRARQEQKRQRWMSAHAAAPTSKPAAAFPSSYLVPMFAQMGSMPEFHDVLRDRKVCLSSAGSPAPGRVSGSVHVRNLGFEKRVTVRYTADEWATVRDVSASYIDGSCDGFSDRFDFELSLSPPPSVGQRVQFCVRFESPGCCEFWDSNGGANYVFQCVAAATASAEDTWPLHY